MKKPKGKKPSQRRPDHGLKGIEIRPDGIYFEFDHRMVAASLALIDGIQDGWFLYHSGVSGYEGVRWRVKSGIDQLADVNNETWQLLPGDQPKVVNDTLAKMRASGSDEMGMKKGMQLMLEAVLISTVGPNYRPHEGLAQEDGPSIRNQAQQARVCSTDVDLGTHLVGHLSRPLP